MGISVSPVSADIFSGQYGVSGSLGMGCIQPVEVYGFGGRLNVPGGPWAVTEPRGTISSLCRCSQTVLPDPLCLLPLERVISDGRTPRCWSECPEDQSNRRNSQCPFFKGIMGSWAALVLVPVRRGFIVAPSSLQSWEALKCGLNVPGAAHLLVILEGNGLNL